MPETPTTTPIRNKTAIRVGMILDQRFPPDARVEREAIALVEAGFEVHLLCVLEPDQSEREFVHHGIHVHRVIPEKVDFLLPFTHFTTRLPYRGLFKSMCHNVWNIDTVWHTLIRRFVRRFEIQVLHAHDLRLVSTVQAVAKHYNIPVVADLHENYPALMEMFKGRENPARGERQRRKWESIQQECCTRARAVITVSDEMKDILMSQGIAPEKITVLPNTVDIEKFNGFTSDPAIIKRFKSSFLLTYVGHINGEHRGIHTVLEAMALLKDEIPEIRFIGAGGFRDHYMADLQAIIRKHNLEQFVEFTGWLDESEFCSYIEASDVCLTPHVANDQTNTGIPNKVYLYHLAGKPILASNFVPMKRYIESTQGGLWFESGNPEDMADKVRILYHELSLRKQLGDQGKQAVMNHYNWGKTSLQLVRLYQQIATELRYPTLQRSTVPTA